MATAPATDRVMVMVMTPVPDTETDLVMTTAPARTPDTATDMALALAMVMAPATAPDTAPATATAPATDLVMTPAPAPANERNTVISTTLQSLDEGKSRYPSENPKLTRSFLPLFAHCFQDCNL